MFLIVGLCIIQHDYYLEKLLKKKVKFKKLDYMIPYSKHKNFTLSEIT